MLINSYRFALASGYDTDAQAYITAVEAADGASLETATRDAINAFVVGCKADGIWTAIKASCILAGAKTLSGALVPLLPTMPAPTPVGFGPTDSLYNRKTGLKGDGSQYLNSNRNNNADPEISNHNAVYVNTATSSTGIYMSASASTTESGDNNFGRTTNNLFARSRTSTPLVGFSGATTGLIGINRSNSANYTFRTASANNLFVQSSQAAFNSNICIFAGPGGGVPSNGRLAFYSIGESLDLGLLDTRVTALITAFSTAF